MMMPTPNIFEVIYVSTIAPNAPLSVVADIAARSRAWNSTQAITGLLIFDGMRFCQQLEGAQKEVLALIERISSDSRHTDVTIFHHGKLPQRRFKNFALAFTDVTEIGDIEVLARLEKLDGQSGVSAFEELVDTLDLRS